jgi:Asp-tRNA(Asn)/Glu-tRNA(Gln) amidotransferase A subunit family amidase
VVAFEPVAAIAAIRRTGAVEAFGAITANTRAINYMGLPSVSVPCGFDSKGLPIGFQIQGRPFAEARVLKVAHAYQQDTDWHKRVPVLSAVTVSEGPSQYASCDRIDLA